MRLVSRLAYASVCLGAGLACAGLPFPDALDGTEVVEDPLTKVFLDAEDPGGARDADTRATRATALGAWLPATPDIETWRPHVLQCLSVRAAETTEDCYARATADFAPKPAAAVNAADGNWKLVIAVRHAYLVDTAAWDSLVSQVGAATGAMGAQLVSVGPEVQRVEVQWPGAPSPFGVDLLTALPEPLGHGFVFVTATQPPSFQGEAAVDALSASANAYFGAPGAQATDAPAAEGAPQTGRDRPAGAATGARSSTPTTAPKPEPTPPPLPVPAPAPAPAEEDEALPDYIDLDGPEPADKTKKGGKGR